MLLELSAVMALAQQCAPQVAPETMAAVAHTESRFNPYAIGVNRSAGLTRQPRNREEAIAAARVLLAQGKNIDLGLAQINSNNMAWLGLSVEDAFDPCKSLAAGARVLTSNYRSVVQSASSQQHALRLALSMYNTGSRSRGFGNGYVRKVEDAAARLAGGRVTTRLPTIRIQQEESAPASPVELAMARADQVAGAAPAPSAPPPPAWDVFGNARQSGVHVFGGAAQ
ncbi:lytic transglycosylase domain-containing protein [Brevundimonas vesicularis]|nr:lytic transglycosylase domain-containing protein [Brevundimonas vesicularis]